MAGGVNIARQGMVAPSLDRAALGAQVPGTSKVSRTVALVAVTNAPPETSMPLLALRPYVIVAAPDAESTWRDTPKAG